MLVQRQKAFTDKEHQTWSILFSNLERCRREQAHPIFSLGVEKLGLTANRIPDLDEVNRRLDSLTGWRGVPVEGLEDNASFFEGLAHKEFPIGNFIRAARDVNYTPAPDIFHDLYGHLPLLTDPLYAHFCFEFGQRAAKHSDNPAAMEIWGRLFWFGVEFPLVETPAGRRIFGGGILSSLGESDYSLSNKPLVLPFDVRAIVDRTYKIDDLQPTLFVLKRPEQLYGCLPEYETLVNQRLAMHANVSPTRPVAPLPK